jgi:hypothetical protein
MRVAVTSNIVQGRFKAILVDRDAYLLQVAEPTRQATRDTPRASARRPGRWRTGWACAAAAKRRCTAPIPNARSP